MCYLLRRYKKVALMDFVPDYKVALKQITACSRVFDTYSPAYIVTNEDLRETMRFMPKTQPLINPYFSIACFVYSLQVGINLHAHRPPINGDIQI